MRCLTNLSTDPHFNMAFDEYCLENLPLEEPVFYLWKNRPSVIIGLNQNAYSEVNIPFLEEKGITLARRVTGGGAVYHDLQNLNYTIVGRSRQLEKEYPDYVFYVPEALKMLGLDARVSGRNDILVDGRKVSGFAKRVWKDRLMVHGTLMYDVDLDTLSKVLDVPGSKMRAAGVASVRSRVANLKEFFPGFASVDELKTRLQAILADGDEALCLSDEELAAIGRISSEKFATWEWNYGKSPKAEFHNRMRFSCGTVEVFFSVDRGLVTSVVFGGDFLGDLPSSGLSDAIAGCRYDEQAMLSLFGALPVDSYFDSMTPTGLTALFFPGT